MLQSWNVPQWSIRLFGGMPDSYRSEHDEAVFAAVAPIPFGWRVSYPLLLTIRWIRRGSFSYFWILRASFEGTKGSRRR